MARDEAYRKAEQKIEEARRSGATELDLEYMKLTELPESLGTLTQLQSLNLSSNQLTTLPEWLSMLTQLQSLYLSHNALTALPDSLSTLTQLESLDLSHNSFTALPESLGTLTHLQTLDLSRNQLRVLPEWLGTLSELYVLNLYDNELTTLPKSLRQLKSLESLLIPRTRLIMLPDWLGQLTKLKELQLFRNELTDLPPSLAKLENLERIDLDNNPLNPELAAAYEQGLDAVKAYLRAKAGAQVVLNEAKLILVGEVGKSCLMDALQGAPWQTHDTTHGIEIKPVVVADPDSGTEITLNGWDFGGQRVYRPTHQLFFSSPAVYLVVWKPREGPQQGFVKEWIKLIKHREPDAKVLVVATHGGPGGRQLDIDRQELRDLFGDDTVIDFFHVDSKPDQNGTRRGIEELKQAIARVASSLPEMGRTVPQRWQEAREALKHSGAAYLPLERVLDLCREHKLADDEAALFVTISHRLGHLIRYEHDPALRDIVVLKPDWLAIAISFVLDDEATRAANGMVSFSRLRQLWNDPKRAAELRYPAVLHPIFLRLMERFDLSYSEVEYLIDSFWTGLRCDVMVPCVSPCGRELPGTGLYDVRSLIESKHEGYPKFPCPVCNRWQNIDTLLRNAPAAQPVAADVLFAEFADVKRALTVIYQKMLQQDSESARRFDHLDASDQRPQQKGVLALSQPSTVFEANRSRSLCLVILSAST